MGELSTPKIRNCQFMANGTALAGWLYGGTIYSVGADAELVNCLLHGGAGRYGGGIYQIIDPPEALYASMNVVNCTFINNETNDLGSNGPTGGGAIWGSDPGSLQLSNCLFVGNRTTSVGGAGRGGAVGVSATQLTMTNCTFVANSAEDDGGGVFIGANPHLDNALRNCVLWNNTDNNFLNDDESAQISFVITAPTVTYTDVMNLVEEGTYDDGTNIGWDEMLHDPQFVDSLIGSWTDGGANCTAACKIDPLCTTCGSLEIGQSQITHEGAGYTVDEHVGKLLNPNTDTTPANEFLIVANTTDTITVWGDLTAVAEDMDPYQINDYSLDSSADSPCIDAGDQFAVSVCALDLDGNQRFVDDLATPDTGTPPPPMLDMGAFEFGSLPLTDCNANALDDDCEISEELAPDCNTNGIPDECDIESGTSLDCQSDGVPDDCCPEDFNGDGTVNGFELAILLGSWGPCTDCVVGTPSCECQADLNNDCVVNAAELALLLGAWGVCQ